MRVWQLKSISEKRGYYHELKPTLPSNTVALILVCVLSYLYSTLVGRTRSSVECPRRFFHSDREILHTSSMRPCKDLTYPMFFFVLVSRDFWSVEIFRKIWTTFKLSPNIFGKKKKKRKTPEGQTSGWACRTHTSICKIAGPISQKRRGHYLDFCASK